MILSIAWSYTPSHLGPYLAGDFAVLLRSVGYMTCHASVPLHWSGDVLAKSVGRALVRIRNRSNRLLGRAGSFMFSQARLEENTSIT